jgi:hypothetical protein
MIFLLPMEPLCLLFQRAQHLGLLHTLQRCDENFKMSLLTDDATIFINLTTNELRATRYILKIFGEASGLITNLDKTEYYPIRCQDLDHERLLQDRHVAQFPWMYLGLPLHYKRLPRYMIMSLVQKIGNGLPGWKRNMFTYPGRELLVKTVLSAMPTYFFTAYKLPRWAKKEIDRYRHSFL